MSDALPLLECRSITKRFGGITALDDVDFDLARGEVHGLVGSNGAGKSTLMKILAGVLGDYRGEIRLRGKPVRLDDPRTASRLGIAMVYQELSGVGQLSVAENLFLGRQPVTRWRAVDWSAMRRRAAEYLAELGIEVDVERRLDRYPLVVRQMVEIARGVHSGADILILDEPTSALSSPETQRLFALIRHLRDRGVAIVFISHFIEEVLEICDRVTVLRDGCRVITTASATKAEVLAHMLGDRAERIEPGYTGRVTLPKRKQGTPVLTAHDLALPGVFSGIGVDVVPGEILGLYGFVGAGHQLLVQALAGAVRPRQGTITLHGGRLPLGDCHAAVGRGVVLVPADRAAGLVADAEVYKNVTIAHLRRVAGEWVTQRRETAAVAPVLEQVGCRPADPLLPARNLSGGNQQKVVFGKWLIGPIRVLLLDEPTRGMDVGAKAEVLELVRRLRDGGTAVIMASCEPELLLQYADRILVMKRGRIVREFVATEVDKRDLMQHA